MSRSELANIFSPNFGNREESEEMDGNSTLFANGTNETCCKYVFYTDFSRITLGLVAMPVLIFGIMANIVSARIFSHKVMRASSINWYLLVLSISDIFVLVTSFFFLALPRIGELFLSSGPIRVFYFCTPFIMPLGLMAQSISVYMTVLMSIHRFIGVMFPFQVTELVTKTRVKTAIAIVIFFAILFNSTRFFEVYVERTEFPFSASLVQDNETIFTLVPHPENGTFSGFLPDIHMTKMRMDDTYKMIFYGWAYTIIMFIIPFGVLIAMNTTVVFAVDKTRRLHSQMHGGDDGEKKKELAKEISTSVMLIGIVVVFLFCNTLPFITNMIEVSGNDEKVDSYNKMVIVGNLLVMINASINIFVYCLFSEKYRALLKYYLCCYWMREGEMLLTSLAP